MMSQEEGGAWLCFVLYFVSRFVWTLDDLRILLEVTPEPEACTVPLEFPWLRNSFCELMLYI